MFVMNKKRKSILIIHKWQFGYLTDVYKWCQYLCGEYDITVVSLNREYPTMSIDGVRVVEVCGENYYFRGISFLIRCIVEIFKSKGVIILCYFNEVSILRRIFPKKKMILDIRTLSINVDDKHRKKYNSKLKTLLSGFSKITVISEGVKSVLGKKACNASIVPLGAELRQTDTKKSNNPRLLYVGTLYNRRIEDTINGLKIFIDNNPNVDILYDIIGDGEDGDLQKLCDLVQELNLKKYVTFHGRIPNNEIGSFLDKANIGVSYVPITDYYQHQPPTKTFEYVLSGLLCLATSTYSNKELINESNGYLIQDNPESFAKGLEYCCKKITNYNPELVKETLLEYTWENIVNNKLKPVLDSLYK